MPRRQESYRLIFDGGAPDATVGDVGQELWSSCLRLPRRLLSSVRPTLAKSNNWFKTVNSSLRLIAYIIVLIDASPTNFLPMYSRQISKTSIPMQQNLVKMR